MKGGTIGFEGPWIRRTDTGVDSSAGSQENDRPRRQDGGH